MTLLLDEPRNVSRLTEREVSPPVAGPGRIEMPTHPAMPRLHTGRLRLAPAPKKDDVPTGDAGAPAVPAPRMDWIERAFEAGWVGLVVACAAECAWRLL